MRYEYSKTLSQTKGSADQRIEQLRRQLQIVQEETEDMLRSMERTINRLQEQIETLQKAATANEEATA